MFIAIYDFVCEEREEFESKMSQCEEEPEYFLF